VDTRAFSLPIQLDFPQRDLNEAIRRRTLRVRQWSVGVSSDEREIVKVYVVVTLAGLRRDAHLRLL